MADNHVSVEMDTLSEETDRPSPSPRSPARTPATARRRVVRAVPETDEDREDDRPDDLDPAVGVDDGLMDRDNSGDRRSPKGGRAPNANGGIYPRRPSVSNPYPGYVGPGTVIIDGVETQIPDVNAYQHKKTLAQGMMDLALLSANANQLRYVLESYRRHPYFYPSIIFITLSIIFQVAVGVGLILNSRYNIKDKKEICKANRINNFTIIGVFIITVVNVFVSAFGVADAPDVGA